jgi:SPP1 gp7 family putative phage head morphogenesis protein
MLPPFEVDIDPNEDAVAYIKGKAAINPAAFGRLPRELKGKAFTVAAVEDVRILGALRDEIARLPAGADWREVRKNLATKLSPFFDESPEGRKAARAKAELILKTNGFQAYAVGRYAQQQANADIFPYLQYITVGDDSVRPEHRALDGKIFRINDPFWQTHYPPWEFGCRCLVESVPEEDAKEAGVADGSRYANPDGSYHFDPSSLAPDPDDLRERYGEDWAVLAEKMRSSRLETPEGRAETVWDWCLGAALKKDRRALVGHAEKTGRERAVVRDYATGEVVATINGNVGSVRTGGFFERDKATGRQLVGEHVHPGGNPYPSPADVVVALHPDSAFQLIHATNGTVRLSTEKPESESAGIRLRIALDKWQQALDNKTRTVNEWIKFLNQLKATGGISYRKEEL